MTIQVGAQDVTTVPGRTAVPVARRILQVYNADSQAICLGVGVARRGPSALGFVITQAAGNTASDTPT